jgi:hypothetical protein
MPWGVAAAVAGAATSAALAPSGGGTSSSSGQPYYTPTGLGPADTGWQQLLQSQMNAYSGGNPYAPWYQSGALNAGNVYGNLANYAASYGGDASRQYESNIGAQGYLQGVGQDVYNLARDPQSALYNRTQQQLTDQVNAGQALRGLGTSAVGGQEYNQAMSNFNIDWQNQQLNRALQGAQGLSGLYGQAGNYGQAANQNLQQSLGFGEQSAQYAQAAGQVPYAAANAIQNQQIAQAQGIQGQIIPYLNYGQGAVQNAYAAGSQNAGAAGALVNQGIQGLAGAFGGSSGYSGYTGPGSVFGTGPQGYDTFGGGNSSYGAGVSPVSGYNTGVNYSVPTYGFGQGYSPSY